MTINFEVTSNNFNPGYAINLENRELLKSTSTPAKVLMMGDLPERIDPRQSKLASENWLQVEDQGQIGSCQGQSLTECGEYCFTIATGKVIQLSRMMAYILSQMKDNIKGDSGSTLSGGTKAFLDGICLESIGPYTKTYPGWNWLTQEMKENGKNFILKTHTEIKSADECKRFIGSGIGIVQIGISWGNEMTPDNQGCIRRFTGSGGGGHAIVIAGYIPDSDIGIKSSKGYWLLLKNSWSKRWGVNGYAYVDPAAFDQMCNHRFSVMYGRSDMNTPVPRTVNVDFTKPGNSMYY
jgi:hypothetical protein